MGSDDVVTGQNEDIVQGQYDGSFGGDDGLVNNVKNNLQDKLEALNKYETEMKKVQQITRGSKKLTNNQFNEKKQKVDQYETTIQGTNDNISKIYEEIADNANEVGQDGTAKSANNKEAMLAAREQAIYLTEKQMLYAQDAKTCPSVLSKNFRITLQKWKTIAIKGDGSGYGELIKKANDMKKKLQDRKEQSQTKSKEYGDRIEQEVTSKVDGLFGNSYDGNKKAKYKRKICRSYQRNYCTRRSRESDGKSP